MSTILVIEDDRRYRDILTQSLEREGYTVQTAQTGREGLEALSKDHIDLILLDLVMPEIDGAQFLKDFVLQSKRPPVIVLTNLDKPEYPPEVREFILKTNISLDELVAKVKTYLPQ